MGEHGSRVIGKLVEGQQEERSLVWKGLNLPQHLTTYIASSSCSQEDHPHSGRDGQPGQVGAA